MYSLEMAIGYTVNCRASAIIYTVSQGAGQAPCKSWIMAFEPNLWASAHFARMLLMWESYPLSLIWKYWLHSQPLAVSNLWVLRFDFGCTCLPYLSMTNHSIFTWASRLLYHETVQLFRVDYPQQGSAKHRWSKRGFKSSREPEREASGVPKQANRLAVTCGNWITCRSGMRR